MENSKNKITAITAGIIFESSPSGKPLGITIDLDIINNNFKLINAWKDVELYLKKDLQISKHINTLNDITFGGLLIQFKRSIDSDINLKLEMTPNEEYDLVKSEIEDYIKKNG